MKRVLVVDDGAKSADGLSKELSKQGLSVQLAHDDDGALHKLRAWKPHIVTLSCDLKSNSPSSEAIEKAIVLVSKLKSWIQDDYTVIVLALGSIPPEMMVRAIEAGVDELLLLPCDEAILSVKFKLFLKLKELHDSVRRASHRIEELTMNDDLTGVLNMRSAYRRGEEEISRSRRFRKPLSAIILNLDGFSAVNQSFGFLAGSSVLQETAQRIRQCLRSIDLVARIGADEFFVLLGETDLASAEFVAERMRDAIHSAVFKNEKANIKLTASVGVASLGYQQIELKINDLLHFASEAMRSAKANGMNRVEVYSFS